MAINPEALYPGKINPSSPDYPFGSARDVTTPGDGTGTPWKASNLNDIYGFHQALLAKAGITPSGSPETAQASQYLDALSALFPRTYATFAALLAGAAAGELAAFGRVTTLQHTSGGEGGAEYQRDGTTGTPGTGDEGKFFDAAGDGWAFASPHMRASQWGIRTAAAGEDNADQLKAAYGWLDNGRSLELDVDFAIVFTDTNTVPVTAENRDYALALIDGKRSVTVFGAGVVTCSKTTSRRCWALVFKDCDQARDSMNVTWGFVPVAATVTASDQHGTMLYNCTNSITTLSKKDRMDGAPFSCTGYPVSPAPVVNTGFGNKCVANTFEYYEQCSTFGAGTFELEFANNVCRNHWLSGIKISTSPVDASTIDSIGNIRIADNFHFWTDDFEVPLQSNGVDKMFPHAAMFETGGKLFQYHGNTVDMSQLDVAQVNSAVTCLYVLGGTANLATNLTQDVHIAGNNFMPTPHHINGNLAVIAALPQNITWEANVCFGGWVRMFTSNTPTLKRGVYSFNFNGSSPIGADYAAAQDVNFFIEVLLCEELIISGDLNGGDVVFGNDVEVDTMHLQNLVNFGKVRMNSVGVDEIDASECYIQGCQGESYQMEFVSLDKMVAIGSSATTDINGFDLTTNNANCTVNMDVHVTGITGESAARALVLDTGLLRMNSYNMSANAAIAFQFGAGVTIRGGDYYGNGAPTQAAWPGVRYTDLSASGSDKHYIKTDFTGAVGWRQIAFV